MGFGVPEIKNFWAAWDHHLLILLILLLTMQASQIYILIAVITLGLIFIGLIVLKKNKKKENLTPLMGLAFVFIAAGIAFGDNDRWFGYGLMGVGIILAILDAIKKYKNKK